MTQLDLLGELNRIEVIEAAEDLHLGFTADLPEHGVIERAAEAWEAINGIFGMAFKYRGWQIPWFDHYRPIVSGHNIMTYRAYLGCNLVHYRDPDCACVGDYVYRVRCEPCDWVSRPADSTNAVVELWHDHAWPGWRDLPAIPLDLQDRHNTPPSKAWKRSAAWRAENYGPEWDKPGAPVVTERAPIGTRHVEGRSPNEGYDLSDVRTTEATP